MITLSDRHDLHIQITGDLYDRLKSYSEANNENISRVVRESIQDKVNRAITNQDIYDLLKSMDSKLPDKY